MKSKLLRYEMKLPDENDWNEVSETAFRSKIHFVSLYAQQQERTSLERWTFV